MPHQAFADTSMIRYLARPGHERALMRSLLAAVRARHQYQVVEESDFECVALMREVPEAPPPAGDAEDDERGGYMAGGTAKPAAAEGGGEEAAAAALASVDEGRLRAVVEAGSLEGLLELGLPRPQAGAWPEGSLLGVC